jgi:hypothetical protein
MRTADDGRIAGQSLNGMKLIVNPVNNDTTASATSEAPGVAYTTVAARPA